MSIIILIAIRIGYKSLYGLSTPKLNLHLHSNIIFISATNITTANSTIPIFKEPCDAGDKYRIRASRKFNKSNVNKCLHPEYHTQYYDDIVNTLIACCNVLHQINVTFTIVQGTLLSILRNQPILPWDADADIYLVLDDSMLNNNSNISRHKQHRRKDFFEPTNTDDYDMFDNFNSDYGDYYSFYDQNSKMQELFDKVLNATDKYKSNAKNGKEKYQVRYDVNDAPNVFRFMKQEATNWGCTGYTDIYVITIDEYTHTYSGGDAGKVAHKPVDIEYMFPVKYYTSNWFPHWEDVDQWEGETLNSNIIPIPAKPHEFSELAYPNHMIPDRDDGNLTCTLKSETQPFISHSKLHHVL